MAGIIKDRAVILRTYEFGESSLIAVALARDSGKIRLLAKGARRTRSPLYGGLKTGALGEIVYYSRRERDLQLLSEIDTRCLFDASVADLEKMCIFQAGLEIADHSIIEQETGRGEFDLLEMFIKKLLVCHDSWQLFFALEVRLLGLIGFLPSISMCDRCGKPVVEEVFGIDTHSGNVTCAACSGAETTKLSINSCRLLCRMVESGFEGVEETHISKSERREIGRVLHGLFAHHIDNYELPNALRLLKGA